MIYMDNAATTLQKPEEVKEAILYALEHMGNAGRQKLHWMLREVSMQ